MSRPAVLALEIHPSGLRALDEKSGVFLESPAAFYAGAGTVSTGDLALRRARLNPTGFRNRFWEDLSQTPLSPPVAGFATPVDLAYAHLQAVLADLEVSAGPVLLAVSPLLSREALALLLGIAEASGLSVQSLLDAGVAAGSDVLLESLDSEEGAARELRSAETWWCVDIGPGTTWALPLEPGADGRSLRRAGEAVTLGSGFDSLQHAWLAHLGGRFVQETRFDPLHSAEGEQSLFDLLPECVTRLRESGAPPVVLRLGDSEHRTQVGRAEFVAAGASVFEEWRTSLTKQLGEQARVLLSAALAAIPGSSEVFARASELRVLRPDAALRGSLAWGPRSRAPGAGVERLTRLGARAERAPAVALKPPDPPTHLLLGDRAFPLAGEGEGVRIVAGRSGLEIGLPSTPAARALARLSSGTRGPELSLEPGVSGRCNGASLDGQATLRLGDRLSFDGVEGELRLIHVRGDRGA